MNNYANEKFYCECGKEISDKEFTDTGLCIDCLGREYVEKEMEKENDRA